MNERFTDDWLSRNSIKLYRILELNTPLEKVLIEGRYLVYGFHDPDPTHQRHMHFHRKVFKTYNPETQTVVLSQLGSRRLLKQLEIPDKEVTLSDLEGDNSLNDCLVKPRDYQLY